MKKSGFTLVELLVVISIIATLAAITLSISSGMVIKGQVKRTEASILALSSACAQYKAEFHLYPCVDTYKNHPDTSNRSELLSDGDTTLSDEDFEKYNQRLLHMIEERVYSVDEIRVGPFLKEGLPKNEDDGDTYVDAWGKPLYVCPGRDHSSNDPVGPNNLNSTTRSTMPLDIYSSGQDETAQVDNGEDSSGSFVLGDSDDIVSWFVYKKTTHTK